MGRAARVFGVLGTAPFLLLLGGGLHEPNEEPGVHALCGRHTPHDFKLLPGGAALRRRESVREAAVRARGRTGAQPAASELLDDDSSAHPVPGVHLVHDSVRFRDVGADQREAGHPLDRDHPALDPAVVVLLGERHHLRHALGVPGARLGWILVLGSGGERVGATVADGYGVPPLDPDSGKPGDAQGLEHGPGDAHVPAHDFRDLPDAVGPDRVGSHVRRKHDDRVHLPHVHGSVDRDLCPADRVAVPTAQE